MEKPKMETYGYQSSTSFDEDSGWMFEGGEEAYYEALRIWNSTEEKQECRICGKSDVELHECKICNELYCNDCSATYNQFSQIDYNCCSNCSNNMKDL